MRKISVEFFVGFALIYAVILVNSRVVPKKPEMGNNEEELSPVSELDLHQGDHIIHATDYLLAHENKVVLSRKRKWAIPADVQDKPCGPGKIRRDDAECIFEMKKDDDY